MATLPALSRQYVYVPLEELNFDLSEADVNAVAFMDDPVTEPDESDWKVATKVTEGHALYKSDIGDSLTLLVGPTRGDSVTTETLAPGQYLVWFDLSIPDSDERVVDWAGPLTIMTAPGSF